jgi:ABC-type transporter Mla subunit MlaD
MSTQNARLEDLAGTIGSYIEQLQGYESRVENNYSELLANMEKAVNSQREFIGQNERFVQNISEASYKINSTSSNLDDVSSNIANISESLQDNMSKSNLVVQNGTETIQSLIARTEYVNKLLADSFDKFGEQASEKLTNLFSIYTESIQKVCGNIQAAVGELSDERIDELKDSIDELNKNISQYLKERV